MANAQSVKLTIGNKPYVCHEAELEKARKALSAAWRSPLSACQAKAAAVRTAWDHHDALRKDTGYLIPAVIDLVSKKAFPASGIISQAEQAVNDMTSAVGRADPKAIGPSFETALKKLAAAATAIKDYETGLFESSSKIVADLEAVKATSKALIAITGAFASGGASVAVTASVEAGVGTYDELLVQIDKAYTSKTFDKGTAITTILVKGAAEGLVSAMFAKTTLAKSLIEEASKSLAKQSFKTIEKKFIHKIVEQMWSGALEEAAKTAIKDYIGSKTYDKSLTIGAIAKHGSEEALKKARAELVLGLLDKRLSAFAKAGSPYMKAEYFKGFGKVDFEKALQKGGEKAIEKAMDAALEPLLEKAKSLSDLENIPVALAKKMGSDPKLGKELQALSRGK